MLIAAIWRAVRDHRLVVALFLPLFAAIAFAQVELPRYTETVEVRIANVDVIVTDRNGLQVRGLTRDDFEVFDDGVRQEITNLSEFVMERNPSTRATLPPATSDVVAEEPPPRHIIVFLDCLTTNTLDRKRAIPSIAGFLEQLRPIDDAMIVTWNRSLNVTVPPTSDKAALLDGLRATALRPSRAVANNQPTLFADLVDESENLAAESRGTQRKGLEDAVDRAQSIRALNTLLGRLAGLTGRKALILLSSGFGFGPNDGASDQLPDVGTLMNPKDLRAGRTVESVVRTANAAGVTIYTLHGAGLHSGISATTRENTNASATADKDFSIAGLRYLAARTGGLSAAYVNGFTYALGKVNEDLSHSYSIGYRVTGPRLGAERRIEVRARNLGYRVRSRFSSVQPSAESEIKDQVISALLFTPGSNELGIAATADRVERVSGKRLIVPIAVTIPMSALSFAPLGTSELSADVTIYIASGTEAGERSAVRTFYQRIPVKRRELRAVAGQHYTYHLDVDFGTQDVKNRFSIAVLDNVSKATGFTTIDVDVP